MFVVPARGPPWDALQEVRSVGIGVGLFLIAAGAILTFALGDDVLGTVNVDVVGVILMVVGLVGLVLSVLFWSSFAPSRRNERTVVRDREIV
jgi:Domain of unknown function (DUF6458)